MFELAKGLKGFTITIFAEPELYPPLVSPNCFSSIWQCDFYAYTSLVFFFNIQFLNNYINYYVPQIGTDILKMTKKKTLPHLHRAWTLMEGRGQTNM